MLHTLRKVCALTMGLMACSSAWSQVQCPPAGWSRAALVQLKAANWTIDTQERREALALELMPCLATPDPELRDTIAFEALSAWLRQKKLSVEMQRHIFRVLMRQLQSHDADADGFAKPFAALTLAEVARADRVSVFLGNDERNSLVDAATAYLRGVDDYRGFVQGQGWRHGVAHGADLLMQLALNPLITKVQLERLVSAAQSQVAPASGHFYIHGESERLARPMLMAARRQLIEADWWLNLLDQISAPGPLTAWDQAFSSQAGLARLHNTKSFLFVLYANLREITDESLQSHLLGPVHQALRQLP